MRLTRCTLVAAALVLAACSSDTLQESPFSPQHGKAPAISDPTASWLLPLDGSGLSFTSDGRYAQGASSVYENGVCGVIAKIFASTAASNSGDATMQTDNSTARAPKCAPRLVSFTYPDGASEVTGFFGNLHEIHNTSYSIPVGATVLRSLNLSSSRSASRCGVLKYRPVDRDGNVLGADQVLVTRVDARTWDVQTQPAPYDRAYCTNTGELYNMPLQFRVVASRDLS